MASDISLAVGDGARRMTYAELADVRASPPMSAPDVSPDIRTLRDQLNRAEVTIAFQRREIEMLFGLLAARRPWWRRWVR
jgi:hypothetical protein